MDLEAEACIGLDRWVGISDRAQIESIIQLQNANPVTALWISYRAKDDCLPGFHQPFPIGSVHLHHGCFGLSHVLHE
jgi:hypothetical protein